MKIYKYASFDKGKLIIDGKKVLLNNPENYNDPFDCLIKPLKEDEDECHKRIVYYFMFKTFAEIIENESIKGVPSFVRFELKLYKKILKKKPYYDKMPIFDNVTKIGLEKYSKTHPEFKKELKMQKQKFIRDIELKVEEIRKSLLVTCFSKTNNSILLWSHYGDSHRGVCIEYDLDPKEYETVKYRKKRQQLDLKFITAIVLGYDFIGETIDVNNPRIMESISKVLLTKSRDWKYESEVRMIRLANKPSEDVDLVSDEDKHYLRLDKISKVFVGCRASQENINELKRRFPDVQIVQMKDSDYKYELSEVSLA